MIHAERLFKGDTIGVVAPASPPNLKKLEKAIPFMESMGLNVKVGNYVSKVNGYLAGTDAERLEDFHQMFHDPSIKAIFCAGGGYGTARITDSIDMELIKKNPKIFWGYSDITYLHTAIRQQTGLVTFHGPMLSSDIGQDDFDDRSAELFHQLFEPKTLSYDSRFSETETIAAGETVGPLTGGNLSLIVSGIGTAYEIDVRDKILFIEDIDEAPYRVDSMLNQLKLSGKLKEAAGIVVGGNRFQPDLR